MQTAYGDIKAGRRLMKGVTWSQGKEERRVALLGPGAKLSACLFLLLVDQRVMQAAVMLLSN